MSTESRNPLRALARGAAAFGVAVGINAALALGMAYWADRGQRERHVRLPAKQPALPFVRTTPPAPAKSDTPRVRHAARAPSAPPALNLPSAIRVPALDPGAGQARTIIHPTGGVTRFALDGQSILTEDMVDDAPRPLRRGPLRYPRRAEAGGIEGEVEARLLLDSDGSVLRVSIVSGTPPGVFEAAAQESLSRWHFSPATFRGQRLRAWVRQKVVFTLQ